MYPHWAWKISGAERLEKKLIGSVGTLGAGSYTSSL
jgi:hypothetical protein